MKFRQPDLKEVVDKGQHLTDAQKDGFNMMYKEKWQKLSDERMTNIAYMLEVAYNTQAVLCNTRYSYRSVKQVSPTCTWFLPPLPPLIIIRIIADSVLSLDSLVGATQIKSS